MGLRRKARERAVQALYQLDGSELRPDVAQGLSAAVQTPSEPASETPHPLPAKDRADLRWTIAATGEPKVRKRGDIQPPPRDAAPAVVTETRPSTIEETLRAFWASFDPPEPEIRKLSEPLIKGVLEHLQELDGIVESSSLHWRVDRMARVDRNILRLGVYELRFRPEVPTKVCLNEAIEVARKYGAEDSGAFINGVLDRVAHAIRGPMPEGNPNGAGAVADDPEETPGSEGDE